MRNKGAGCLPFGWSIAKMERPRTTIILERKNPITLREKMLIFNKGVSKLNVRGNQTM